MKQLKSSVGDLRRMFARTITLRDIAEPLVSFDHTQKAAEVREFMERREFDVVGVREQGIITGYLVRSDLNSETIGAHGRKFVADDVLPDSEPLLSAFAALSERRHVFINVLGQVGGIVTRGDLQKAPVRLWLFGLVSLLEMQLLRVVRERYPADAWMVLLTEERCQGTRRVFAERQRRREENDLSDCLQLGDKATIFLEGPRIVHIERFSFQAGSGEFFQRDQRLTQRAGPCQRHRQWALADVGGIGDHARRVSRTTGAGHACASPA
ncbi:MAG: hypothetical protein QM813_19585 [Verrucomicrobiota bacterium]